MQPSRFDLLYAAQLLVLTSQSVYSYPLCAPLHVVVQLLHNLSEQVAR